MPVVRTSFIGVKCHDLWSPAAGYYKQWNEDETTESLS